MVKDGETIIAEGMRKAIAEQLQREVRRYDHPNAVVVPDANPKCEEFNDQMFLTGICDDIESLVRGMVKEANGAIGVEEAVEYIRSCINLTMAADSGCGDFLYEERHQSPPVGKVFDSVEIDHEVGLAFPKQTGLTEAEIRAVAEERGWVVNKVEYTEENPADIDEDGTRYWGWISIAIDRGDGQFLCEFDNEFYGGDTDSFSVVGTGTVEIKPDGEPGK
jgi:hypothetical protein